MFLLIDDKLGNSLRLGHASAKTMRDGVINVNLQ